jgi:hypothetical protein
VEYSDFLRSISDILFDVHQMNYTEITSYIDYWDNKGLLSYLYNDGIKPEIVINELKSPDGRIYWK